MGIKERIQEEMLMAQKAGERIRVSTFRLLKSAIRYEEDTKRHELNDEEIDSVISRLIKQRKESIEFFKQGNRQDLVEREEQEIRVLQEFLPPQLDYEELKKLIEEAIVESGSSGIKDMGKVMKMLMPKVRGRADGDKVKALVSERLNKGPQAFS